MKIKKNKQNTFAFSLVLHIKKYQEVSEKSTHKKITFIHHRIVGLLAGSYGWQDILLLRLNWWFDNINGRIFFPEQSFI